jgi:hypothetical protein
MLRNKFILLATLIALGGCATDGGVVKTVVQKVEIPISVPCKAKVPTKPNFNFDNLKEEQGIDDKVKSLLADRKLHLGYEEDLSAALNACVK